MEDKEFLIEAIIPSAKNVAANLGLKGKNITQWDLIVNNIITEINNDTYNPTTTYSTPKKGVFGYDMNSLLSIADLMVALIKASKKPTATSNPTPALQGSKYKSVYDWGEEWDNGYSSETPFEQTNEKTFNGLITSVTQALNKVKSLDNTVLLKGFKGKKESITNVISELNSLKNNFTEENYNKFVNILNNLGIDGNSINTYFEKQSKNKKQETTTKKDASNISYNGKTIQYYDNPFEEDYGKIVYGDKTYNNLNDLYKDTRDSELINTIVAKIKKDNERFKSYDLNDLTGYYDLTFDDNGKYYDVTNVYGNMNSDYTHILAKTDDINKFNWISGQNLYGVTEGGEIEKISDTTDLINGANWYNITYDPEIFSKLLNAQYITGAEPSQTIKITKNIERPGMLNDLKIRKDGELGFTWFNNSDLSTQDIAKHYLDNFDGRNGNEPDGFIFMLYMNGNKEVTALSVKDFLLTLYNVVDDPEYKKKALELMKYYELKFKKGGILKALEGNKTKIATGIETADSQQISTDVPQDVVQSILTGASDVGSIIAAKKKSKLGQLLSLLGLSGSAALDFGQNGGTENIGELILNGLIAGLALIPENSKWGKRFKWFNTLGAIGNGLYEVLQDADDHDKINTAFRVLGEVISAQNMKGSNKNLLKRNKKNSSTGNTSSAQQSHVQVKGFQPENNTPTNKLGGQLNYLKLF